ncbi:unnamed protein product, partial [Laminaria digitata]
DKSGAPQPLPIQGPRDPSDDKALEAMVGGISSQFPAPPTRQRR